MNLPHHIAFIMDGNGRWAQKRGLVRTIGHRYGYEKMLDVVKHCAHIGIKVITLFAFSTENWNRPKDEIDEIFHIIRTNMERDSDLFKTEGIRITTMGDVTAFPADLQQKLAEITANTKTNNRCTLNLCINYGGRADILRAVNNIIHKIAHNENTSTSLRGGHSPTKQSKKQKNTSVSTVNSLSAVCNYTVDESEFARYLYNPDLPPPDLIVRTSGEQRISNFMLWQMAYSEFLFIKSFWPDMTTRLVDKCIANYQKRKRRFGKV